MTVLAIIFLIENFKKININYAIVVCGASMVAYYPDHTHWLLHMLGLFIMLIGIFLEAARSYKALLLFFLACVIFVARIVLKLAAIYLWEDSDWIRYMKIMYDQNAAQDQRTIFVFSYGGGVLQWISLFTMSFVF